MYLGMVKKCLPCTFCYRDDLGDPEIRTNFSEDILMSLEMPEENSANYNWVGEKH